MIVIHSHASLMWSVSTSDSDKHAITISPGFYTFTL